MLIMYGSQKMKKSEAEKLIADTLKSLRICVEDNSDENKARHILTTLISVGMLPPKNEYSYEREIAARLK